MTTGEKQQRKRPFYKQWWLGLVAVAFLLSACGIENSDVSGESSKDSKPDAAELAKDEPIETEEIAEEIEEDGSMEEEAAEVETIAVEEPKAEEDVPREYKSALKQAESYAEVMHMSKQGIFEQLTSEYGENFSTEAAEYAMSKLEFDWNANALKSAEDYSETMHLSKLGIYEQLTSEHGEGFTAEEAQYAVDNLQADYKEHALVQAKDYQDMMDMSPEAIRDQLTSEYGENFTQEEADYAIEHLND